jgi:hypothetical protein
MIFLPLPPKCWDNIYLTGLLGRNKELNVGGRRKWGVWFSKSSSQTNSIYITMKLARNTNLGPYSRHPES